MSFYLDNGATTRVCTEAAQAALVTMTENYGNPSSTHKMGRDANKILETARAAVANALGAQPREVFFTSGGTEADNWALLSGAESGKRRGRHIISSLAEHSAVKKSLDLLEARGFEVTRLTPERDGSVSLESVLAALREDTILVSLMLVNNETGGITDISEISRAMKKKGSVALLHTDAVQGFLKIPCSATALGADLISISGHKIHGPKGVGALYIRGGEKALKLAPLLVGGVQEFGRRAGTEGLPQIVAFGAAAELGQRLFESSSAHMLHLKEYSIKRLTAENEGLHVLSGAAPHLLSVSLPGYKSEVMMNFLEAREVYVSKGSACSKGRRSTVLEALGLAPALVDGTLRIGFSRYSTLEDADALCDGIFAAREGLFKVLR